MSFVNVYCCSAPVWKRSPAVLMLFVLTGILSQVELLLDVETSIVHSAFVVWILSFLIPAIWMLYSVILATWTLFVLAESLFSLTRTSSELVEGLDVSVLLVVVGQVLCRPLLVCPSVSTLVAVVVWAVEDH